jgi:hypothetical protein
VAFLVSKLLAMKTLKVDPAITFDHMHGEPNEIDETKINEYQKLSWIIVGVEMLCIIMLLGFMFIMF